MRVLMMTVAASLALVGCLETTADWPPKPPVPEEAKEPRHPNETCVVTSIKTRFHEEGPFLVPDTESLGTKFEDEWRASKLDVGARVLGAGTERFKARPYVNFEETKDLAFTLRTAEDSDGVIVGSPKPGKWYPWEVFATVDTDTPELRDVRLLKSEVERIRGWVMVSSGDEAGKIWIGHPDGTVSREYAINVRLITNGTIEIYSWFDCGVAH